MTNIQTSTNEDSSHHVLSRRQLLRYAGAGAVSALLAGSYGAVESSAVVVERHELKLPKWDADGFRVAVVSDIHANETVSAARTETAVRLALAEQPDLIVLPGDFINWIQALDLMVHSLRDLNEAKCPVIGTLGNHDYWTDAPEVIVDSLQAHTPMRILMNESLDVDGVTVAGIDDAIAGKNDSRFIGGLENKSVLALLHEPDYIEDVPTNASLQISGHSHGGQICLPFGIPLHTPIGSHKYQKGYYPDARVPLYVTRGVGTVGAPMRTFCPPEVSLLTLRSAV